MSVDTVTGNESSSYSSDVSGDNYGDVDVSQTDGGDITSHIAAIKGFTSQKDIQDYIDKNIVQFFKSQSPPNLSAIDRTINDLIISLAGDNEKLAAVVYHAADTMPNNNLTIQDTDLAGKRKIVFGSSVKAISDSFFNEIATASQDIQTYTNNYFNTTPTTDTATTETSTSDTSTSDASTSNTSPTDTATTDTPKPAFSEEILAFLPDDTTLEDLDETLIIDIKTGKEIDPKDYDKNDPEEVAKLEKIMETAITIKTDGHHDGLADDDNAQKIADALVKYITRPYEESVSEDGLQDILDNLSLEMSGHIFNTVQNSILNSGNPADIIKLTNFKNKINDNGLDGIIAEVYNYNYLGGNTSDPSLFLMDIFKNDPSKKLNTVNIDQIATILSEQLNDFLSDTNEPPDKKPLDFISQALGVLSTSNPENLAGGHIEALLQKIASKTSRGKSEEVKDIISDLALNSGIDTVKTATIQTGQSLISNFGEFTYTNDTGTSTTFSSDDVTDIGGFKTFSDDIIHLIQGGGTLVAPPADEPTKAVIASQAADMIMALSPTQQQAIIQKLIDAKVDTNLLEHFIPLAGDISTNLSGIIKQINIADDIIDINAAPTVEAKADIFADIISEFDDPTSSTEMDNLIHGLTQGQTEPKNFLNLTLEDLSQFNTLLRTKLQENGIATPATPTTDAATPTSDTSTIDTIIKNLGTSLSKEAITFQDGDETVYAASVLEKGAEVYVDTLKTGEGMPIEDARLLLDSLTPAQKSDPNYFVTILNENNSFATPEEFATFITSMRNILTALAEKTGPEFDTLKTNLTNALLQNKPPVAGLNFLDHNHLKIGSNDTETTEGSYLAFLTMADYKGDNAIANNLSGVIKGLDLKAIAADAEYANHIVRNLDAETSKTFSDAITAGLGTDTASIDTFNTNITNTQTATKTEYAVASGISTATNYDEALANFKALGETITAENFDQFEKELLALMKFSNLLSISNKGGNGTDDQDNITKKILTDIGIKIDSKEDDASPKQAALLELFANASVSYVIETKNDPNSGLTTIPHGHLLRQILDSTAENLDRGEQDELLAHRAGYAIYRLGDATAKNFGDTGEDTAWLVSNDSFYRGRNSLQKNENKVHEAQAQNGRLGKNYVSQFGNNLNVIAISKRE